MLQAISTFDDDMIWHVSHSQPAVEDGILLRDLVDKRRRLGLTPKEETQDIINLPAASGLVVAGNAQRPAPTMTWS